MKTIKEIKLEKLQEHSQRYLGMKGKKVVGIYKLLIKIFGFVTKKEERQYLDCVKYRFSSKKVKERAQERDRNRRKKNKKRKKSLAMV